MNALILWALLAGTHAPASRFLVSDLHTRRAKSAFRISPKEVRGPVPMLRLPSPGRHWGSRSEIVLQLPQVGLASSIAVGAGVPGAAGAAAAGLMDWLDVDPPEKAIGAFHA